MYVSTCLPKRSEVWFSIIVFDSAALRKAKIVYNLDIPGAIGITLLPLYMVSFDHILEWLKPYHDITSAKYEHSTAYIHGLLHSLDNI